MCACARVRETECTGYKAGFSHDRMNPLAIFSQLAKDKEAERGKGRERERERECERES